MGIVSQSDSDDTLNLIGSIMLQQLHTPSIKFSCLNSSPLSVKLLPIHVNPYTSAVVEVVSCIMLGM